MTSPAVGTGIVAFIEARLDDREELARAATAGPWVVRYHEERYGDGSAHEAWSVDSESVRFGPDDKYATEVVVVSHDRDYGYPEGGCDRPENAEHIAANDPRRVLAEVAKDSAILALHFDNGYGDCRECQRAYPCQTVRLLAAIDADHPAYRPEWKPVAG